MQMPVMEALTIVGDIAQQVPMMAEAIEEVRNWMEIDGKQYYMA